MISESKMAAPGGKEVSSPDGRSSELLKANSPSAPLANVPTAVLVSFEDDVMPVPPRRNKSLVKKSKMEPGCEPSKSDRGALLPSINPELPAKDYPGFIDVSDSAGGGCNDDVKSAAIADKSSCETAEMEEDFQKEGNTNTCRSELRHNSSSSEVSYI